MKDLFDREEQILQEAASYAEANAGKVSCSMDEFNRLVKEYARILKLLKRVTKVSDQTAGELNEDRQKLIGKVHFDELTGIYNRRYLDESITGIYEDCADKHESLGILMLDIDFFKQYNDTYGHIAGDRCLKRIAGVIDEVVNVTDGFTARYGGEEFVAVIQGINESQLKVLAERILTKVRELEIVHAGSSGRHAVTISIGGFDCQVRADLECREFIIRADQALYRSKQSGRDCYTLYSGEE